jgi:outer membrane protein OmpA-like peptidoglycan-associated protein
MRKITSLLSIAILMGAICFSKQAKAQLPGSLVPIVLLKAATGYWGANDDSDGDGVKDDVDPCPNRWGKMNGCPWSDKDGDGLSDIEDGCPEVAGKTEHNGCPDKDGDGVADNKDACPDVKGLVDLGGCPDSDGDGVADKDDSCPDVKGLADLGGCPDSDGDGIADKDDACPNEKGTKALNGCPDGDSDGVADKDDVCPTVAGLAENKGCPAVKEAVLKTFEKALNGIKFASGRDKITTSSYKILGDVVTIMEENPTYNLKINGYTDSSGDDTKNLALSKKRAAAVQAYLVKKGISEGRLSSDGFGEASPVADNKTSKGRATNRRVELKVEFSKLVK